MTKIRLSISYLNCKELLSLLFVRLIRMRSNENGVMLHSKNDEQNIPPITHTLHHRAENGTLMIRTTKKRYFR